MKLRRLMQIVRRGQSLPKGSVVRHSKIPLADARFGSSSVIAVMSVAQPLFLRKRKSIRDLAMSAISRHYPLVTQSNLISVAEKRRRVSASW
jgi:hypothetical protein